MQDLIDLAAELQGYFSERNWKFCFIGGLAVQHWGEPRLTRDVDVTLITGFGSEETYVDELLKKYPARSGGARAFALQHRVLLLKTSSNIGIDIALGGIPFEEQVVARSSPVEMLPGISLRICSAEDLIVLKAFASRPIDWHDIEGVFSRLGRAKMDWKYIEENLKPLVQLKGEEEILTKLKRLKDSKH